MSALATAAAAQDLNTRSPEGRQPPRGVSEPAPRPTPELVRQHGGSLLRAQLSVSPESRANSLETVSFFHVPPPEPRLIQKHDLVTIIIREESSAKSDAKADISRESEMDARLEEFIKLSGFQLSGGGVTEPIPSIRARASREFQGDGKLDRKDSFIARIQAEVIDVKPNGTIVLQARKRIRTDEEEQLFILSGIARAEDVTADNSVLSTQLFDLELSKSTRGPVRDSIKRGAVHRFLDWLNPF
ncbi:MAG: flagellar basal body L-ring protein FlgH [Phycisphaerales bacterium]|nr:flagellar basal body L-ring protein FlgH [Phycisphaerales bacterium]